MMMIKVRHTDRQLYACAKRAQSAFMEGVYCKKYQWGPKIRKFNFCVQDGRCQTQYVLDIRNFLAEATLDTTDLD